MPNPKAEVQQASAGANKMFDSSASAGDRVAGGLNYLGHGIMAVASVIPGEGALDRQVEKQVVKLAEREAAEQAVNQGERAVEKVVSKAEQTVEGADKAAPAVENTAKKAGEQANQVAKAEAAGEAKGGTYKLRDPETGEVKRTGRTNDLDRREGEHARGEDTKDLKFEVDRRTDDYAEQRGREQVIYDQHPEARAENGGLNKQKPISDSNRKRDQYMDAAKNVQ